MQVNGKKGAEDYRRSRPANNRLTSPRAPSATSANGEPAGVGVVVAFLSASALMDDEGVTSLVPPGETVVVVSPPLDPGVAP